VVISKQQKQIL